VVEVDGPDVVEVPVEREQAPARLVAARAHAEMCQPSAQEACGGREEGGCLLPNPDFVVISG